MVLLLLNGDVCSYSTHTFSGVYIYALEKSWENFEKKIYTFSKLKIFCQNGRFFSPVLKNTIV